MTILGISAFFHDSAAAIVKDGKLIAAAQEERFSRIKHDSNFPIQAIEFCLNQTNISIDNVDLVVFYEKPFLKFDRILNSLQYNPFFSFSFFRKSITSWVKQKLWVPTIIKDKLNYTGKVIFSKHHEAHAAGAFFTSPFNEAAILVIDGVGEKACTSIYSGSGDKVTLIKEQHYPHSLGLLYSAFTQYCGFKVNSGEYKLMGLAPYGQAIYKDKVLQLVSYNSSGIVKLDLEYFSFDKGKSTINKKFETLFGNKRRTPKDKLTQFYKDVAASIQEVCEEIIIALAKHVKEITKSEYLCLSGGVALNCKANGKLLQEKIFKDIWVQPASGDAGGAVGAAYIGNYHYLNQEKIMLNNTLNQQIYLGPEYSEKEIEETLKVLKVKSKKYSNNDLTELVANFLADKKIIGWFQGKMEFGPRALGHRSILASPLYADMKSHVNLKIKFREGFRPFAPIVLEEKKDAWFLNAKESKYMLFTFESDKKKEIPSCIHEDNSARVQTLDKKDNQMLHQLISDFETKTNCPVLINTSFNVRGEPIVNTPTEALKCFFQTGMDVLVLENYVVIKNDNQTPHHSLIKKQEFHED